MRTRYRRGRAYLEARQQLEGNPGQWDFFRAPGNCAVLAGPGSGKTKALTVKLARILIEEIADPQRIACITFSNEAVRELHRRLQTLGIERGDVFVGTLHGFCFQQIVRPFARLGGLPIAFPIRVASEQEQESYFYRTADALRGAGAGRAFLDPVRNYRRTILDRRDEAWRNVNPELADLAEHYEAALHGDGLVDFDDIIFAAEQLLREHAWVRSAVVSKFPVIAIDEYQDLGLALHRIVLNVVESGGRVLAVGDPDQSIYGFQAAQPWLLEELSQRPDFSRVVLQYNYRAAQELIDASEVVLGVARGYEARSDAAGLVREHLCEGGLAHQARVICGEIVPEVLRRMPGRQLGDIVVLYVDRNVGNVVARAADDAQVPYQRSDRGAPYPKTPLTRWIERCAAWCVSGWRVADPRMADLIHDWESMSPEGLSDTALRERTLRLAGFLLDARFDQPLSEWLQDFEVSCLREGIDFEGLRVDEARALERLRRAADEGGVLETASLERFAGQRGAPDRLNLMTLHGVKGLEFDAAIIMGVDEGRIPSWSAETDDDIAEARRAFYVGFTRAKHEVHLTYSGFTVTRYGRRVYNGASRFLLELRERYEVGREVHAD